MEPQPPATPEEKTIFRIQKRVSHFTQISNETLRDKSLSFKARGVLCMLLSNVDTWEVHIGWIQEQGTEGREAIQGAMKELERAGYLTHSERPRHGGKFMGNVWTIHEEAVAVTERTNRTKWAGPDDCHKREAVHGEPPAGNHERETVNGSPSAGFPAAKNNIGKEHQQTEHQGRKTPVPPDSAPGAPACGELFLEPQTITSFQPPPSTSDLAKTLAPDPQAVRVASWYKRRETTPWSPKELKAWRALKITLEDVATLEHYYTAEIPKAEDFRRRDLLTLLNNWPGEIDRARAFTPSPSQPSGYKPRF